MQYVHQRGALMDKTFRLDAGRPGVQKPVDINESQKLMRVISFKIY